MRLRCGQAAPRVVRAQAWPAGRRPPTRRHAGHRTPRGSLTRLQVLLLQLRQPLGARPQDGDAEGAGGRENAGSASRVRPTRGACVCALSPATVGAEMTLPAWGKRVPTPVWTRGTAGTGARLGSPEGPVAAPPHGPAVSRLHAVFSRDPEGGLGGRGPHTLTSQKRGTRVFGESRGCTSSSRLLPVPPTGSRFRET